MLHSPQKRNPAGGPGFGDITGRTGTRGNFSPADTLLQRPDTAPIKDVSTLLRHHAGYVEVILVAICAGQSISIAGRRALAYTVDRIRQCAEVLQ